MKLQYTITFLILFKVVCGQASEDAQFDNRSNSSETCSVPLFEVETLTDQKNCTIEDSTTESILLSADQDSILKQFTAEEDINNVVALNSTSDSVSPADDNEIVTPFLNTVHDLQTNQAEGETQNQTRLSSTMAESSCDVLNSLDVLGDLQSAISEEISNTNLNTHILEENVENTTEIWTPEDISPAVKDNNVHDATVSVF